MMSSAAALRSRLLESLRNDDFMGFSDEPSVREAMTVFARKKGLPDTTVQEGGITDALQFLATSPAPKCLVVDVSACADPATTMRTLARECQAREDQDRTVILAVGRVNDVALYRDLVAAGADDYLVAPVHAETLDQAFEKHAAKGRPDSEQGGLGKVITFIGARGGVGASMLAVNCAWLMAHENGKKVALIDLDLHFGTVAINLDLDPGRGLREALETPERIDELFVSSALVEVGENLSVLAAEETLDDDLSFGADAFERLVGELRGNFDLLVIDLPRHAMHRFPHALSQASDIVVVCDLSLVGVRDTLRLSAIAKEMAGEARLQVVVNRTGKQTSQISRREFERGIETRPRFQIPFDPKTAAAAANAGKPLAEISGNSRMMDALRGLSEDLSGVAPKTQHPFSWLPWIKAR